MNELRKLRETLLHALTNIQQLNGFFTNAGLNVRTGWFEEVIKTAKASSPIIVVQRHKDGQPELSAGELVLNPGYIVVAAVSAGFDDYESALDDLEHDIYSALAKKGVRNIPWAPFGSYGLSFGEPVQAPPGGGNSWASLAIPVNFKIIIQRNEP